MGGKCKQLENVRIAYDRTSMLHVFIRRVSPQGVGSIDYGNLDYELLNDFFRARDTKALALAVDRLPPLYAQESVPYARPCLPNKLTDVLNTPVEDRLLRECYCDPMAIPEGDSPWSFAESGRVARAATRIAATSYSIPDKEDGTFFDDRHLYVIEPLHDWLLLRNLISIAMRLFATAAQDPEGSQSNLLVDSGFRLVHPSSRAARESMGADGLVIPVAYNPFFSRPAVDFGWNDRVVWPLFNALTETDQTPLERIVGFSRPRHLRDYPDVKFLTSVQADQTKASLNLKKVATGEADKWIYLALIPNEGQSQKDAANQFLRSLDAALGSSYISCGGQPGAECIMPSYPTNLPAGIWALVKDHPGRLLLRCKRCNRTIFATATGGPTRFCSSACRSAYNKGY